MTQISDWRPRDGHAPDCRLSGTESGECEPIDGAWNQPPGEYVRQATEMPTDDEPPWCRIREMATFAMETAKWFDENADETGNATIKAWLETGPSVSGYSDEENRRLRIGTVNLVRMFDTIQH